MDLIEESMIVELPHKVPPSDDPEVLPAGCLSHGAVYRTNITSGEPNVSAINRRESPRGEDPGGLAVGPGLRMVRLGRRDRAQRKYDYVEYDLLAGTE
jgi:hypothetical protein